MSLVLPLGLLYEAQKIINGEYHDLIIVKEEEDGPIDIIVSHAGISHHHDSEAHSGAHWWGQGDKNDAEFIEFINKVIKAIDTALTDIPKESVRMHVCWGNYNGPHDSDIPLKTILPSLINAKVGALMLSMANPRHAHEYRLLTKENLPEDMLIVAGVIDTTSNYVEHPEVVADRIEAVVSSIEDPQRVIVGTDCGFDTAAGFRDVAEEVVWAKLKALSTGAEIASKRLL